MIRDILTFTIANSEDTKKPEKPINMAMSKKLTIIKDGKESKE
ncbi:hypothetical protein SD77_1884 [Bacillus badius]|uniref:Uncharacterized protein n=1 Tax=Bacillus badius TaxID=1455 RepID=A0ABR5AQ91_BACBA|nr:hypothetical protein SD78_0948 [Bacillus badius]KIL76924.1 hypothetical protein SD77_1884 [Bacillus badius]